ncbi:HPP family protein [uncultured Methylovirgula sp.]|uniref:HPP family protein n=1 Tax=uncultured Methylovirgula sp. TaxID=1285960 RepID=UPI002601A208|nr:HPP family protein [uncultured Methylovirgula sp.]
MTLGVMKMLFRLISALRAEMKSGAQMLACLFKSWGTSHGLTMPRSLWMGALLVSFTSIHVSGAIFLIPPFAATLAILAYLPEVSIAQPLPVVCGSVTGAAMGTLLSLLFGFGPNVAVLAALGAMIMLPSLRIFHPPGVALAMYPALLHPTPWFAVEIVLPFSIAAVLSACIMSRLLISWPPYPMPLRTE